MYKKSELYKMFMKEYLVNQGTQSNRTRINAAGDYNREVVNVAQQAATESTVEIILNMLGSLGIIENDCELNSTIRVKLISEITGYPNGKP